ncbi:MAG: NERD domain-containing protein [Bacteroidaceae bacterium]|nr:NERD domain-containing protein [Bacteroidaceae bacterium]
MDFLIIVICVLFGVLAVTRIIHNTPEYKGKEGETIVHNILTQLPEEYLVLDDIMLKTNRGTTQIDHIVVSKYGVFAIETKNYRGEIYGNDKRDQWKQIILTDVTYAKKWYKTYTYVTKNHFYNPVKQALGHTYEIKKVLTEWPYLKIIPIVVFVGNADLKNVYSNIHVVYGENLLSTIQSYTTVYLRDDDVERIYNHLCQINVRESVSNSTHVHNINVIQEEKHRKIAEGICPKCGGNLILRQGKYGRFYGCSNYPKCKYTLDVQ